MSSAPKWALRFGIAVGATVLLWLFFEGSNRSERSVTRITGGATSSQVPETSAAPESPSDRTIHEAERAIFELTNLERRKHGLAALEHEEVLSETARRHSADMLRRGFFAHENPDGEDAGDRIAAHHRRLVGLTGENIWTGTGYDASDPEVLARLIVESWMKSPGHRENILRPHFTHLGVGIAVNGRQVRATQDFSKVRAYLTEGLPEVIRSGTELDLRHTVLDSGSPPARYYTLWSPRSGQETTQPLPLENPRIDAEPGVYRLRLYFPDGAVDQYEVYPGPSFELR